MEHISHSLEETKLIATTLLASIAAGDKAMIIGLSGDLGAGKTALVKCLAARLGIGETVTSPTFVIRKSYNLTNQKWKQLVHIDAYRLKSGEELKAIGFEQDAADTNNLIVVEWPELVLGALLADMLMVKCEFVDENTRRYIW